MSAEPPRLTPTQRLHEVTMAALSRSAAPPEHSLNLARNAKGVVQIDLTVRGHDLAALLTEGQAAFDALTTTYPYQEG